MEDLNHCIKPVFHEIRDQNLNLILGGGYGIYLKREHVQKTGVRTLYREWPEARSTSDLDLFLRPELLIESSRLKPLASALAKLGYETVPGAEKYQFAQPNRLKIDLLTGPASAFKDTPVKTGTRRAMPRPSVDVHAHFVDEAITLENEPISISVEGETTQGMHHSDEIFVPHPMTFAMMKLCAFRDKLEHPERELYSYHALDVYAVLATTTEEEWSTALSLRDAFSEHPRLLDVKAIVDQYFSSHTKEGIIGIKESPYFRKELQIDEFISDISELFTPTASGPIPSNI